MLGLVAYHNDTDKWRLFAVHGCFDNVVIRANRLQPGNEYQLIKEVEIESVEKTGERTFSWIPVEPLPKVKDLHERVKENAAFLRSWLSKNKRL